jgi:hypothetical protein
MPGTYNFLFLGAIELVLRDRLFFHVTSKEIDGERRRKARMLGDNVLNGLFLEILERVFLQDKTRQNMSKDI